MVKHHSFTEFQILPDHVLIHEDGIQHLVDYEEKHQGRNKEVESEEQEEKVEFSWLSEDDEIFLKTTFTLVVYLQEKIGNFENVYLVD